MRKILFAVCFIIPFFSNSQDNILDLQLKLLQGYYDTVLVKSNEYIEQDSSNALLYYYQAKAYTARYNYFDALESLKKAYSLDSLNRAIENALAETYDFIGQDENAIQVYYNQYLRDTLNLETVASLGNMFRKTAEYGAAIHYYQKATQIDPTNFYFYKQIGYCADKINVPQYATMNYEIALKLNAYDLGIYRQLANIYNSDKNFSNAIHVCNRGLKIYNLDNQLMKIKAYAHYLNKDKDSAIYYFNKMLEYGDSCFFNFKYLGMSYYDKEDYYNAIINLKEARSYDKKDAELTFFIGSAYGRTGAYDEGWNYLNMTEYLLSPAPEKLSEIYSEMAIILLSEGNYELSLEHLKMAYKKNATPILSYKMAQLYDHYLNNKKLAIDCYDAYLTMVNMPDSVEINFGGADKSFFLDPQLIESAKQRISVLQEELFFEQGKKE